MALTAAVRLDKNNYTIRQMPNFFLDNPDLLYRFDRLNIEHAVDILEEGYTLAEQYEDAPRNFEEARDLYRSSLELLGEITGDRIAPRAAEVDLEGTRLVNGTVEYAAGTLQSIKELGEAGFMGVIVPRQFGGANMPASVFMMMIELVSRADGSLMTTFGYQDVGEAIAKYGTPEQGEMFLPKYTRGEHVGAMVLTEPGAGSDLQAVRLKAFQDDSGQWRLNGTKHFISNGNGGVLLILARSEPGTNHMFGLSLFACHGGEKVEIAKVEKKMGLHGSPTCELFFNDAPAELIGKRGMGLVYVLNILNHARFSVAAQALGIADGAYQEALAYTKIREQFGKLIYDMPPVANMLIDMQVNLEWMRSMIYAGSYWLDRRNTLEELIEHLKHEGKPYANEKTEFDRASGFLNLLSPLTKYVVTEAAVSICYDAQQLHGGIGYIRELGVERCARDVRITTIYEGTSQVQVVSCTKGVLGDALKELMDEMDGRDYPKDVADILDDVRKLRAAYYECAAIVQDNDSISFKGAAMKEVVDIYANAWVGYLLLGEASETDRKKIVARRFLTRAIAQAAASKSVLKAGLFADLDARDTICV